VPGPQELRLALLPLLLPRGLLLLPLLLPERRLELLPPVPDAASAAAGCPWAR